jgi:hypothetical protein
VISCVFRPVLAGFVRDDVTRALAGLGIGQHYRWLIDGGRYQGPELVKHERGKPRVSSVRAG